MQLKHRYINLRMKEKSYQIGCFRIPKNIKVYSLTSGASNLTGIAHEP
jgi:hypothetical protein